MAISMLEPFSGTFTFTNLDAGGVTLTQKGEIILQADTSSVACVINLPSISSYFLNQTAYRVKVVDINNNAGTNNITVNTFSGDTFNGTATQVVLNANGSVGEFIMVGTNRWAYMATIPVVSGSGPSNMYLTQTVVSPAQILTLNTTLVTIVSAQGANIVIKPLAVLPTLDFNSVAYATGGALTQLRYGTFNTGVAVWDNTFITSAQDEIYDASVATIASGNGFSTYANQPLRIQATGAITLGNSPVKINTYWIAIKGPN